MTSQTYSLYHALSGATVKFTPIAEGHLAGKVSVQTAYANGNWSSETCEPKTARALWTHWMGLGALDLRKWAVIGKAQYRRLANGHLSYTIIQSIYDYADESAKYAPEGYAYARCEYPARDAELDHDEQLITYVYAPKAKATDRIAAIHEAYWLR